MATTKTSICNLALLRLGHTKFLSNVDTDDSPIANMCLMVYEQARDEVFRDFPWPFATLQGSLTLVEECPNTEWAYSYAYPTNCMSFHRIVGMAAEDSEEEGVGVDCAVSGIDYTYITDGEMVHHGSRRRGYHIPHRIGKGSGATLVLTDQIDAAGAWTVLVTDVTLYPKDFVQTLATLIAAYLAPALTGGDPHKLGERALGWYETSRNRSRMNAANEEAPDRDPDSTLISTRN